MSKPIYRYRYREFDNMVIALHPQLHTSKRKLGQAFIDMDRAVDVLEELLQSHPDLVWNHINNINYTGLRLAKIHEILHKGKVGQLYEE